MVCYGRLPEDHYSHERDELIHNWMVKLWEKEGESLMEPVLAWQDQGMALASPECRAALVKYGIVCVLDEVLWAVEQGDAEFMDMPYLADEWLGCLWSNLQMCIMEPVYDDRRADIRPVPKMARAVLVFRGMQEGLRLAMEGTYRGLTVADVLDVLQARQQE